MNKLLQSILLSLLPLIFINGQVVVNESFISTEKGKGKFEISADGKTIPMLISSKEWPGVIRAFNDLQTDLGKVTSVVPEMFTDEIKGKKTIIIAGTIGKSPLIDKLIQDKKWPITCDIELEYTIPEGSDAVKEVVKCVDYCRKALITGK